MEAVPLTDVIEAYHIAFRETWNELLNQSRTSGADLDVISQVGLLWDWIHRLAGAVADAHAQQVRSSEVAFATWRQQLVEAIARGEVNSEHDAIARHLGYSADRDFIILCYNQDSNESIDQLNSLLATSPGVSHCVSHAGRTIVISQDLEIEELQRVIRTNRPAANLGIGVRRHRLDGAAMSLIDATQALHRAKQIDHDVRFDEHWLAAFVAANDLRLQPILSTGREVAERNPILAETVAAYVDNGWSVSACARTMNIHPNTAKYRLDRWSKLTSWPLDTFDGLVNSMCALISLGDNSSHAD
jgi:sugar diacid utilization regulator